MRILLLVKYCLVNQLPNLVCGLFAPQQTKNRLLWSTHNKRTHVRLCMIKSSELGCRWLCCEFGFERSWFLKTQESELASFGWFKQLLFHLSS